MSPAQWVALVLLAIGVCWLVGLFIALSVINDPTIYDEELAKHDVEQLLAKTADDYYIRRRVKPLSND